MAEPLHGADFTDWLHAAGMDEYVANALISVGFRLGWEAGIGQYLPPNTAAEIPPPPLTEADHDRIEDGVRQLMALPAPTEVAESMGGWHGH